MSVWIIYEEQYSSWNTDFLDELEVFATEGLAQARLIELRRQELDAELSSLIQIRVRDPYDVARLRDRLEAVRKGQVEGQWYDVGMVKDENGVEVWQTRQRTPQEEISYLEDCIEAELTAHRAKTNTRISRCRAELAGAQPLSLGDWKVMKKEVVGG